MGSTFSTKGRWICAVRLSLWVICNNFILKWQWREFGKCCKCNILCCDAAKLWHRIISYGIWRHEGVKDGATKWYSCRQSTQARPAIARRVRFQRFKPQKTSQNSRQCHSKFWSALDCWGLHNAICELPSNLIMSKKKSRKCLNEVWPAPKLSSAKQIPNFAYHSWNSGPPPGPPWRLARWFPISGSLPTADYHKSHPQGCKSVSDTQ